MTEPPNRELRANVVEARPKRFLDSEPRIDGSWRTVEIFVPINLADDKFTDYIHAHIRGIAHDGGEFIERIVIGSRAAHSLSWWRCSVSYLPGPPGTLAN